MRENILKKKGEEQEVQEEIRKGEEKGGMSRDKEKKGNKR